MWAVKGHYYTAYYNWPYTFGLLFGIGLYAQFQRDPDRFRLGYDDLLSATGLGEADELPASASTSARSTSGRPASTSSATASTTSAGWRPPDPPPNAVLACVSLRIGEIRTPKGWVQGKASMTGARVSRV